MTAEPKPVDRGGARDPLIDPVRAALLGPHHDLALGGSGPAIRYPPDVSSFAALCLGPTPEAWQALSALPGDRAAIVSSSSLTVPANWTTLQEFDVLQYTGEHVNSDDDDPDIEPLSSADVPEMLDLVAIALPGPFGPDTIALGGYVGIRRNGRLVAMAGRRFHAPPWIEVSAICTHPSQRGLGLGRRVTAAVIRGIRADGAQPFLHVLPTNPARRLYESMGFVPTRELRVTAIGPTCAQRD